MKRVNGLLAGLLLATLGGAVWWTANDAAGKHDAASPATGNNVAFRDVRVFDGEKLIERANVIVRDGRIQQVGADAAIPSGIAVIDGRGKTLLPGLIDAHAHAYGDARRDALRFGVTTELDLMGDAAALPLLKREREAMAVTEQADIWGAGYSVTVPGGHGTEYGLPAPTLRPNEDVAAFVQARVAEGSDLIKIMVDDLHAYGMPVAGRIPTLTRAQQRAAIAAAQVQQRKAFVHIGARDDALAAAEDGADVLAHLFVDAVADPAFIAVVKQRGTIIIPTLSVIAAMQADAQEGAALVADRTLRPRLTPAQVHMLESRFPMGKARLPALERALQSVSRLHAAGVPLLVGTDAGNPGTAHGASMHGELALFVRAGVPPIEALQAATSRVADVLALRDRGRIAPGLRADLLLVEGDPTHTITDTRRIVGVWKNGHRLRTATAAQVAALPGAALPAGVLHIADFEAGEGARIGAGFQAAGDRMAGGRSEATQRQVMPGANGSRGALAVTGTVFTDADIPWAGTTLSLGTQIMTPVDLRGRRSLSFRVRGTPGSYTLMWMSGSGDGMPATVSLPITDGWTQQRIDLRDVQGVDWARVRGIGWMATTPGAFQFELDDVVLE